MNSQYNCGEISSICITDKTIQRWCSAGHICSHLTVTKQWWMQLPLAVTKKSHLMEQAPSMMRHQVKCFQDNFLFQLHSSNVHQKNEQNSIKRDSYWINDTSHRDKAQKWKSPFSIPDQQNPSPLQLLDDSPMLLFSFSWQSTSLMCFPQKMTTDRPHSDFYLDLFLILLWTLRNGSMHMISLLKRVINVMSSASLATWLCFQKAAVS